MLLSNHCTYAARGVLISGDCKRETGEEHVKLLQTTLDGVNREMNTTKTRVVSLASDGETRRGSALIHLTFKRQLSPDSPIYKHLYDLRFLNLSVGDDDLTADKDYKHVFKRLRNLLLRETGLVVGGVRLTPTVIRAHLNAAGVSADHIRSILNPEDKQDVRLAYDLLKAIWTLSRTSDAVDNSPGFIATQEALWTLGQLLQHITLPYICIDLSISEQFERLSAAAHLAMYLQRVDGKDGVPALLFTDIMLMVKNAMFCVAKAQEDDRDGSFWLILLGTDRLEELFGNLRTMVGNDANLDVLQVSWRISGTTEVSNILAKYPHWDRPPRRLNLPALARDFTPLPHTTDHLKPGAWKGDQRLNTISLRNAWISGRRAIEKCIPLSLVEFSKMEDASYDMFSPCGKVLIGPTAVPSSANDENDLEDNGNGAGSTDGVVVEGDGADAQIEMEDTVEAEEGFEEETFPGSRSFERTVHINGLEVPKSRALNIFGKYRKLPASTDRLKRVQHEERYSSRNTSTISTHLDDPDSLEPSLVIHDPVSTLIWSDNRIWLAVGNVVSIRRDGHPVDQVPVDLMLEETVQISLQLLGLRSATVDEDSSEKYDWRTYKIPEHTFSMPGRLVEAINPTMATLSDRPRDPYYLLDSAFLVSLAAAHLSRLSLSDLKAAPRLATTKYFPYRDHLGKIPLL